MNTEKITYQEIDIKINVMFSQPQVRRMTYELDQEIKQALNREFNKITPEPMTVEELESSMQNAHIRICTSVDWTLNEPAISQYIINKVIRRLPMGVASVELISIIEEAEIYGNKM